MKRLIITVLIFVALFAFTAPLFAADDPVPPSGPDTGGCSGPNCK